MAFAGASAVFVEPTTIANLWAVRDKLPDLKHVIGVGGARETGVHGYEDLVLRSSSDFSPVKTEANDPALIIYTSGTTGPPKGALQGHRLLIGNLPGFEHSHDGFPRAGDLFWSPADWAWTGGLWDALMPTLYHGQAILGYRGRFDPERAFHLLQKYAVRNAFLFPTALKMMMKAVPSPRARYDVNLRSLMSGGEPVGPAVFHWAREELGVTVNEIFGQTEMNYIVGNSHREWPVKPGSMGRPYPGHRVAVIDGLTRKVIKHIAVGDEPSHLELSHDGRRLYIANSGSDDVTIVDTADDRVIATAAPTPRALPAADLARRIGRTTNVIAEPYEAIEHALQMSNTVCVAGSIFVVGAVRDRFRRRAILP